MWPPIRGRGVPWMDVIFAGNGFIFLIESRALIVYLVLLIELIRHQAIMPLVVLRKLLYHCRKPSNKNVH